MHSWKTLFDMEAPFTCHWMRQSLSSMKTGFQATYWSILPLREDRLAGQCETLHNHLAREVQPAFGDWMGLARWACPSLHASFSAFSRICCREPLYNVIWTIKCTDSCIGLLIIHVQGGFLGLRAVDFFGLRLRLQDSDLVHPEAKKLYCPRHWRDAITLTPSRTHKRWTLE